MILLESLTQVEVEQLLTASIYLLAVSFGAGVFCRFLLTGVMPGRY